MHDEALRRLAATGLLLLQDSTLPSVAALVAGGPVRGSWWAHPRGREIFRVERWLDHHPDVLTTKLIGGKVTFVHRELWPSLLAVAMSRAPWQIRGLSPSARRLLKETDAGRSVQASGAPVKELERRLLVHTDEQHTESGAHRIAVEPWSVWAARVRCRPRASIEAAMGALEAAAAGIGAPASVLPWSSPRSTSRPRR